MRNAVITLITVTFNVVVAMVVASMLATSVVYAQDTSTTQRQPVDMNSMILKKLNANIIDAINAEIRSVYGD